MTRFPPQTPMPYEREVVLDIDEEQRGCYGLLKDEVCIYIGKGDLRARMLAHLDGDNPCITSQMPTHWIGVATSHSDALHAELIEEYGPVCNRHES